MGTEGGQLSLASASVRASFRTSRSLLTTCVGCLIEPRTNVPASRLSEKQLAWAEAPHSRMISIHSSRSGHSASRENNTASERTATPADVSCPDPETLMEHRVSFGSASVSTQPGLFTSPKPELRPLSLQSLPRPQSDNWRFGDSSNLDIGLYTCSGVMVR